MAKHILKGNNVKLEGRFHLDTGEVPGPVKEKEEASATPQVSIVENQPEFAVIEITCSCGTKSYVRCEYTADKPPAEDSQMPADAAPDDAQNGASEDLNQEPEQKIEDSQMSVDATPSDTQNGASEDLNQKPE
jgi:hypothetical protein